MPAALYNFTVEKGATFTQTFTYKDASSVAIDISTATDIQLQVRDNADGDLLLEATLGDGFALTTDGTDGQFTLTIIPADSLLVATGVYSYDLLLVWSATNIARLLYGKATFSAAITHGA